MPEISPEDAPLDPAASDDLPTAQDASEPLKGRDRPFWWKIRQDAPGPVPPHPAPLQIATRGTYLPNTGLRGWSTLTHRAGPGWMIIETHAIGYRLMARSQIGELTESIAVRARHAETRAVAVAFLQRPLIDPVIWDEEDAARKPWKFSDGLAWIEAEGGRGPQDGRLTKIGARLFSAALKGDPPLVDGAWPVVNEPTDEEE